MLLPQTDHRSAVPNVGAADFGHASSCYRWLVNRFTCCSSLMLCLALSPFVGLKAQPSSVRDCTPVLAKDYFSYAMKNDLQEDFLRSVDSESYSQAKEEINSNGSAYGGAFTGSNDYTKFNEARDKYLESVHYSRNQQQALDILQITTSDRAYTSYEACLRSVAAGPALLVWASRESMNEIELRVKYINAPKVPGIELYGTVVGGTVKGEPDGYIWSKGPWYSPFDNNKWGVNEEKTFTINRTPGSAETTITVKPSDGSPPFQQTFKRADAVFTLSYVGQIEVSRGQRISDPARMPDNNENKSSNCPNFVGLHDGKYCTSRTPMTITTTAPRLLKSPTAGCVNNCGWLSIGPSAVSADGLTATSYVDNWGSPFNVVLRADEYERLSTAQCGRDQKIPVILGHPMLFSVTSECQPIAQILWQTLAGIPSQGSLKFSSKSSSGGEVVMVGDANTSGSVSLASYKLNKLPQ
jgi:hypothetical protein